MEKTHVSLDGKFLTEYTRKGIPGIITWWSKVKETSLSKDLVISTLENYDKIIINGKEI